jgi:hypothetical protein
MEKQSQKKTFYLHNEKMNYNVTPIILTINDIKRYNKRSRISGATGN